MTNHFRIVLIETLWNVNINNWIDYCFCFHVLIETLWNVNYTIIVVIAAAKRY